MTTLVKVRQALVALLAEIDEALAAPPKVAKSSGMRGAAKKAETDLKPVKDLLKKSHLNQPLKRSQC